MLIILHYLLIKKQYIQIPNGTLAFRVLNALTYKEDPVPEIEFNLWVSAGSDFKVFNMHAPITFDLTTPVTRAATVDGGRAQIAETSKMTAKSSAEAIVPLVMSNAVETVTAIHEATLKDAYATSSPVLFLDEDEQFKEGVLRLIAPTTTTQLFGDLWSNAFRSTLDSTRNVILSFPYYDWYNLMFRFRRGDYIYTSMCIDIATPQNQRTSARTLVSSAGVMDTGSVSHRFLASYLQLKNLLASSNLPTLVSSDGTLMPHCVRVPYSSSTKFAITDCQNGSGSAIYPELNKSNVFSTVAQRSQLLVYRSAAPDMKFYFQVGPPAVFVAN